VVNQGLSGSTNRDNPKSVSFTNGPEDHAPTALKSLVKRISEGRVNLCIQIRGDRGEPTLEFDVTMYKGNAVHPSNSLAQLAPNLSKERLVKLSVLFIPVDEIKQFRSVDLFQHEAVMRGCRKRVDEGNDVGVADMLK
jgi:hypothetical protein